MSRDYITCHILDTVTGLPAPSVPVSLSRLDPGVDITLAQSQTDSDGRVINWPSAVDQLEPGLYKMRFDTGAYLERSTGKPAFFPFVEVCFNIPNPPAAHYHIPLLLSNYSYSTYRGS